MRRARVFVTGALVALALGGCASAPDSGSSGPVSVMPQRDWSDAVLYFVMVDRFADGDTSNNDGVDPKNPGGWHGGDLKGLAANLDEIADLGATAIWITPIQKQIDFAPWAQAPMEAGGGSFEHTGFHGYWMDDFNAIDPHFGTEEDLTALVEAAHARGMKVLLDVVYNHTGYGSRYEKDMATKDWIRKKEGDCAADAITCAVGGLPDFKTERDDVRKYLLDANLGLAARTGIDGFRLDTVKHVEHDFWQLHRRESRERVREDFFLLAEVWGGDARGLDDWFENDEMDAGFDFGFRGNCESFVEGKGRTVAYSAYLEKRHRVRDGYHLSHYMSSHDEPLSLHILNGDKTKFRLCVALQMTSLGIPMIFYGEEVARSGSIWPTNRRDMPWGRQNVRPGKGVARDEAMRDWYKQLIQLRRDNPALSRGDYAKVSHDGDLLVFSRTDPIDGGVAIVAVNRGTEAATADVPLPDGWAAGAVVEALSGVPASASGTTLNVSTPAQTAQIYLANTGGN